MDAHFVFHYSVMKGLGPEWTDKLIEVYLDDLEEDTSNDVLQSMAKWEAERQLTEKGFEKRILKDFEQI